MFLVGCLILVIVVVVVVKILDILAAKLEWDAGIVSILRLIFGLVALIIFIALLLQLFGMDLGIGINRGWGVNPVIR